MHRARRRDDRSETRRSARLQPSGLATAPRASNAAGTSPAPLLREIPADTPTLHWTPEHRDLLYTFGGAPAKHRIASGTYIVSWTEDCFDGAVKTARDLPSKVMPPAHDNPQTGPFHIERAEPGGTLAVHLMKLEPARDYDRVVVRSGLWRARRH